MVRKSISIKGKRRQGKLELGSRNTVWCSSQKFETLGSIQGNLRTPSAPGQPQTGPLVDRDQFPSSSLTATSVFWGSQRNAWKWLHGIKAQEFCKSPKFGKIKKEEKFFIIWVVWKEKEKKNGIGWWCLKASQEAEEKLLSSCPFT